MNHFDNLQAGNLSAADSPQSSIFLVDLSNVSQTSPFPPQVCVPLYGCILTSPYSYRSLNAAYTFAGCQ